MSKKEILKMLIQTMIGLPYRWGGDDFIEGFDCSGGVLELIHSLGMGPSGDTTADGLMKYYQHEGIGSKAQFGALAFYGKNKDKAIHVTICLNESLMFEFGGGGSRTKDEEDAADQNAYGRVRPIRNRRDLITILMPNWFTD